MGALTVKVVDTEKRNHKIFISFLHFYANPVTLMANEKKNKNVPTFKILGSLRIPARKKVLATEYLNEKFTFFQHQTFLR